MNGPAAAANAEKVGVARIRIRKPERGTAVLGSFVAADKVLKAWAAEHDCIECEFEIRYLDGYLLSGLYPLRAARQSLGAHVRRALGDAAARVTLQFDAGTGPERFLDRYEVEDFA